MIILISHIRRSLWGLAALGVLLCCRSAAAQEFDLAALSLDELMDIQVYSAAKKDQQRFEVAAAIAVITREDIQRSGLTTVAEVLRLAPGVQVGRIDVNKWGVSIRGFNGRFANKLLVLVDGRSVYTPVFAGVYWREQDLLQDIERVEVVRGPGGALWGANAVNGIVNIITRPAADTQGVELVAAAGNEERGNVGLRYGGRAGDRAHYRLYASGFDRAPSVYADGREATDQWRGGRFGARLDWGDEMVLGGEVYRGTGAQTYDLLWSVQPPRTRVFVEESVYGGGHLLARWERAGWALQAYYDLHDLDDQVISERRHTFDLEFQQRLAARGRHEVLWGAGYRLSDGEITGSAGSIAFAMDPAARRDQIINAFAQDDIDLGAWRLHAGVKFEHNPYTELEVQPSLRLLRRLGAGRSLWAAVSRAVRTPARAELHLYAPSSLIEGPRPEDPFTLFALRGNPDQAAENLVAYEAGYRVQPRDNLFGEAALFWHQYDDLRSFRLGAGRDVEGLYNEVNFAAANRSAGSSYGLELEADWEPRAAWRLQGSYTHLRVDIDAAAGDPLGAVDEGQSPAHAAALGAGRALRPGLRLDLWGRYVGAISGLGIDDYYNLDARLAWQAAPGIEVALVGQNLLAARRAEFSPEFLNSRPTQVQRGAYLSIRWRSP